MSNILRLGIPVAVCLALLTFNVLPLRHGEKLFCNEDYISDIHMNTFGIPLEFLQAKGKYDDCATAAEAISPQRGLRVVYWNMKALWLDLAVNGALALGVYFALNYRKATK